MLAISNWGEFLVGRDLGKKVRIEILKQLEKVAPDPLIIDFSNVRAASHSFCDEAFGITACSVSDIAHRIKFINIDNSTKTMLKHVILERIRDSTARDEQAAAQSFECHA